MNLVLFLLAAVAMSSYTYQGYSAGCLFNAKLEAYAGNYTKSAVFANSEYIAWNMPNILFEGPNIGFVTATAGVALGLLAPMPKFYSMKNASAFDAPATGYGTIGQSTSIGSTYYFVTDSSGPGSSQGVLQVRGIGTDGSVDISVAFFSITTIPFSSSWCVDTESKTPVDSACSWVSKTIDSC